MRLIDADALVQILDEYDLQLMIGWVEDAPTIDAIPVVRCRECMQSDTDNQWHKLWCDEIGHFVDDCGYCSMGQRREDGDAHDDR